MAQEDQGYVNVSESGSEVANAAQTVTNDISDSEMYGEGETPVEKTSHVEDVPPAPPSASPPPPVESSYTGPTVATGYLSYLNVLHPTILYIIYWRDVKFSAVVLGVCLVLLLTLMVNTVLHTFVLLLLSFMVVSLTYTVSKLAIDSFFNREIRNPFSAYLNSELRIPEGEIVEWTKCVVQELNCTFNCLLQLLLFKNVKSSLIFGLLLWIASSITNSLSFLNILFVLVAVAFSVPYVYTRFQSKIDDTVQTVIGQVSRVVAKVQDRIPIFGKSKKE
ncbi:hypothetical protein EMCRGX_G032680 [Ephydatia muelleri]|eukprot:Em0019g59a